MKNLTKVAIFTSFLFAIGCGESDPAANGENEVRSRCTSKCDDATSSLKVLEGMTLVGEGSEFNLTSKTVGELDNEVWIDIEIDNEVVVLTEMFPSADGTTYDTKSTFDLPAYETMTVVAFGFINSVKYEQKFVFTGDEKVGVEDGEEPAVDPFAAAKDVEAAVITIDPNLAAPDYKSADVEVDFALDGTEFWQKWVGGENPTYSYSVGSEAGRKCMYASARRFEAIMADPPQSILELKDESNWNGRFFNWNDDYSPDNAQGSASGSVLWAWKTHLVKFISQTAPAGKCHLPTKSMLDRFAKVALTRSAAENGEIEGAQSR